MIYKSGTDFSKRHRLPLTELKTPLRNFQFVVAARLDKSGASYCLIEPGNGVAKDKVVTRVVPTLIPVLKNAADTSRNAGIGIGEYTSLCTDQIPYHVIY